MRHICAWCGTALGADSDGDAPVSHGICLACADNLFADQAVPLQSILDKLPIPVLVVDSDVTVSVLNKQAQALLGTALEPSIPRRGGELFDCTHSHLPGGCGRTIHCGGCALRRAVTRTHETGEPQVFVPATLKRSDPDDSSAVTLTITTIKRNNLVLVRIDKVE